MKALCLAAFALSVAAQSIVPVPDKTFEFHSGFWFNLHHFLTEQALASPAPPVVAPEWTAALDYYRREILKSPGRESVEMDNRLSALENATALKGSGLPREMESVLDAAAPIYRSHWWETHDRANREWIHAVSPLLSQHSSALKRDLAKAYLTTWPSKPIRTDVAEYANWAGAYSTYGPSHIIVSSTNQENQGDAALETLFHEASHTMFTKILDRLSSEARAQNKLYRRRDVWHAIIFYTAGEMVQRQLGVGYTPVAIKFRIYDRGWQEVPEILDRDWKPYLDGKIDLATAVRRLLGDYGISQGETRANARQ